MQSVTRRWAGWGHRPCPRGGHLCRTHGMNSPTSMCRMPASRSMVRARRRTAWKHLWGNETPSDLPSGAGRGRHNLCPTIHTITVYPFLWRMYPHPSLGGPGVGDLRPRKGLNHQTLHPPRPPVASAAAPQWLQSQEKLGGQRMGRGQLMGPEQGPLGDCGLTETHELRTPRDTSGEGLRGGTSYNSTPGGREGPHERKRGPLEGLPAYQALSRLGWRHGSLPVPFTQGRCCNQIREETGLGQGETHRVRWDTPLSCHPWDKGAAAAPSHPTPSRPTHPTHPTPAKCSG